MVEVAVSKWMSGLTPRKITMIEYGLLSRGESRNVFPPRRQIVVRAFASAGEASTAAVETTLEMFWDLAFLFL